MSYPNDYGRSSSGGLNKQLGDLGGFVKRHGVSVATTAFNYKMGGTIGKVLAAGQAADLAQKYQKEQKMNKYDEQGRGQQQFDQQQQQQYGGAGSSGSSGYYGYSQSNDPYAQHNPYKKKHGSDFDSLMKSAKDMFNKAEKTIKTQLDKHGHKSAASYPYTTATDGMPPIMSYLNEGTVIQLISNMTHRSLQIVASSYGQLVFDANGPVDNRSFNTQFSVVRAGPRTIMLRNNQNFLALNEGRLMVYPAGPGGRGIDDCRLNVSEPEMAVISLDDGRGRALAMGPDGLPIFGAGPNQSEALFVVRFLH